MTPSITPPILTLTQFLIMLDDWAYAHADAQESGYQYQSPDATGMSESEIVDIQYLAKLLVNARPQFKVGFKGGVNPLNPADEVVWKTYLLAQANSESELFGLSVLD